MKLPLPLWAPPALAALLWTAGCDGHGHDHDHADHPEAHDGHDADHEAGHDADHADADGGHAHAAPHGGALIALGDHVAHVEVLLDPESGGLTAWVLDGHAERGVRVAAERLVVEVTPEGAEPVRVTLAPVASELTGETAGDTSQFVGADAALAGVERFSGTLEALEVKGVAFADVAFAYPGGNE